ncbi:glycosyltransferase family 32 protein [Riemerella columbipharyngis]|uniref:glycosyltransferase family 32 protein n=1 Tax=Riemerella columbipharyngis TaxID=1071918 RepID=UPI001FDFB458|nr:glycosyltransferase [Riemerella columbipharyngis]
MHYCWFGGKPLPELAKVCIESWKRNFPGFEIMEWNEKNFDINSHQFVKECCEVKKYGFVVDVLRNHVLKEYGGIYLDTDV